MLPENNRLDAQARKTGRTQRTRQRILRAAAEVFAAHGYTGATTRLIAERAEISELTLFRHFGTKKNLFMSMLQQESALPGMAAAFTSKLTGDPRRDLQLIGEHFLKTISERRAAILMTLSEAERLPEVREVSAQVPRQQRQMLAVYLSRHIEGRRLRALDPILMAQAFLGMLFAYAINQALLDESTPTMDSLESVVAFFVDVFIEGVSNEEHGSRI